MTLVALKHRLVIVLVALLVSPGRSVADPPPAADLLRQGLAIDARTVVPLPQPLMLTADTQPETLAGRLDWRAFSRDNVNAPVWLQMNYLKDAAGRRIGQTIEFRFIVHVAASGLHDQDWTAGLLPAGDDPQDSPLKIARVDPQRAAALLGRSITPEQSLHHLSLELLNRVIVSGTVLSDSSRDGLITWQLIPIDTAAADQADKDFAGRWRSIDRDDVGKRSLGDWQAYQGAGGYVAVHSLAALPAAAGDISLVQGVIVFHEPEGWFGGSNFLRSKFPLLLQESVRKLRRELD